MATNTLSSAFRKLDIDQYNEDLFVDESGGESAELVQVPGPDEAEVNALLNRYDVGSVGLELYPDESSVQQSLPFSQELFYAVDACSMVICLDNTSKPGEALKVVLKNAPINAKGFDVKDKAFGLAMKCMLAIRVSEMDAVISSLEPELVDTLMKYIYRGFESPAEGSSGHLLAWHEKVFAQGGLGCIIRVMTARKSV